jgi:hypothetical protein
MRGERAHSTRESLTDLQPVEQAIRDGDPAVTVGAKSIAAFIRSVAEKWVTVHHGAAPIIEITGTDTAKAIWPLFDFIDDGVNALRGYGHYHENYRKIGERWLTSTVLLTRVRTDGVHPWSAQKLLI